MRLREVHLKDPLATARDAKNDDVQTFGTQ